MFSSSQNLADTLQQENKQNSFIIDSFQQELLQLKQSTDMEIAQLKEKASRLEAQLSGELKTLANELATKRRKEAALEENLLQTKAALEEDERHLAEDKELFAKKDAEIEGLKKRSGERRVAAERLGNLQKEHEALKSDRDKTHKELEDAKVECGG